jgi:hypothetical protein
LAVPGFEISDHVTFALKMRPKKGEALHMNKYWTPNVEPPKIIFFRKNTYI